MQSANSEIDIDPILVSQICSEVYSVQYYYAIVSTLKHVYPINTPKEGLVKHGYSYMSSLPVGLDWTELLRLV